jgi:hypothetical protein
MGSRDKLWAKSSLSLASRICSSNFISWIVMGVKVMVAVLLCAGSVPVRKSALAELGSALWLSIGFLRKYHILLFANPQFAWHADQIFAFVHSCYPPSE